MARLFSFRPALSFEGRRFRGVRGWAGKPSHPPLTDIPIACYILVAVFDVLSYLTHGDAGDVSSFSHDAFVAGTFVIISGAIVSLGTITTGFWDWWKGIPRRKAGFLGKAHHTQVWRTINTHATVMVTVTVLVVVDIIVRLGTDAGYATLGITILSVLAGLLVTMGAAYGGSLVFDYQFNVEDVSNSTVWDETEVDQTHADRAKPKG